MSIKISTIFREYLLVFNRTYKYIVSLVGGQHTFTIINVKTRISNQCYNYKVLTITIIV